MNPPPSHVIDTSALIDLQEWYPRNTFPSLWDALEEAAKDGRLRCPREVLRELEKKNPDLHDWVKRNGIDVPDAVTVDLAKKAAAIDAKYPDLKKGRRRSTPNPRSADPWVVALAVSEKATVVSNERPRPNAQSVQQIPDACRLEGTRCVTLTEFFRDLGLRF